MIQLKNAKKSAKIVVNIGENRNALKPLRVADLLISQWQGTSISRISEKVQLVHYFPHACNPRYHYRVESTAACSYPLCFVGNNFHRDSAAYDEHVKPHEHLFYFTGFFGLFTVICPGKQFSTFSFSCLENTLTPGCFHSFHEAVLFYSFNFFGLPRSFRHT